LNQYDRHRYGSDYDTNLSTIRQLSRSWVTDNDPFRINQLGHPYQGSMYQGFARSAGLGFWESFGYTLAGAALWEIAGETTPPSKNDLIASGIGGSFLGESLFRMANLVLERASGTPPFWREALAAVVSPSMAFNRLAFGERFDSIYPSRDAMYYSRVAVGVSQAQQNSAGSSGRSGNNEALADFSIDYGLPGKADYAYKRPFDYFAFQATASSANGFENVMTRGLLLERTTRWAKIIAGLGLYGSYDYMSPQFFAIEHRSFSWHDRPVVADPFNRPARDGSPGSRIRSGRHSARRRRPGLSLWRGAAGPRGAAPDLRRHRVARLGRTRVFRDPDLRGRPCRARQHCSRRRGADLAHTRKHAIALRYLWNRRDTKFPTWRPDADARHPRHLLRAARPRPVRGGRLAVIVRTEDGAERGSSHPAPSSARSATSAQISSAAKARVERSICFGWSSHASSSWTFLWFALNAASKMSPASGMIPTTPSTAMLNAIRDRTLRGAPSRAACERM
jgi:hypothetical protein